MNCTHPVLYNHPDGLRCHICGALISANDAADKPEGQKEKPAEAQKPGRRKRKAKGADGNENH
jgi:hypothetical protein